MEERKEVRPRVRGSLFGPLILIAIGVIFLFNNLGWITGDVWENLVRFWPVLLIAIGLDSIYRREGLVGAAFLIGLGVVFLLANLGYLQLNVWQVIIRLWPILLIAIGFDILVGRRSLIASLFGLVVVLAVLIGALWLFGVRFGSGQPLTGQTISQPLDGASEARVVIEPGAAGLHIEALSGAQALIDGRVADSSQGNINEGYSVDGSRVTYTLQKSGADFFFPAGRSDEWDLGLTTEIPLELEVNLGAGEAELDLAGLELTQLDVNVAVGMTEITLPEGGDFDGTVESAIGQIVIFVPQGTAVRINADAGLANVSVPAGFDEDGDIYTSPGYASADNRIELDVSQAIGSISIREGSSGSE